MIARSHSSVPTPGWTLAVCCGRRSAGGLGEEEKCREQDWLVAVLILISGVRGSRGSRCLINTTSGEEKETCDRDGKRPY